MSKSLNGCLTTAMEAGAKIPKNIQLAADAVDLGSQVRGDDLITGIEAHIKKIQDVMVKTAEQHKTDKVAFSKQAVRTSVAGSYVNRPADKTNELNQFKAYPIESLLKNLVQRAGSIINALALKTYLKKNQVEAKEDAMLKDFSGDFLEGFVGALDDIFIIKTEGSKLTGRVEDMMQYLPIFKKNSATEIESGLDMATKTAMASAAYEFLARDGESAMMQSEESLHALLDLEKGEKPNTQSTMWLTDTGVNEKLLAEAMGKVILDRMSITDTDESDVTARRRMELALGFMTIAVMEEMNMLVREDVYAAWGDENNKEKIGIEALKAGQELTREEVFAEGKDSKTGRVTITLMRVPADKSAGDNGRDSQGHLIKHKWLEDIQEAYKGAEKGFEKIFNSEVNEERINWEPPKKRSIMKIGRTSEKASNRQLKNIQKYNDIKYNRSAPLMDMFGAMYRGIKEQENDPVKTVILEMLGAIRQEDNLNINKKSVEGTNRGIELEFQKMMDYEAQAKARAAEGKSTSFFTYSDFMSNMRMIMRGDLNPQNNKMHRSFFSQEGWNVEFDKTDQAMVTSFREAIAYAFDIESGKVGGNEKQLEKLEAKLKDPAIIAAIETIQAFNTDGIMNVTRMRVIAAGSKAIGNKAHGLKGLMEYARFDAHTTGPFKTDIHAEIDGVSNGPIIGILQLIPDSADKRAILAQLAMGGISTSSVKQNLDKLLIKHNLNDAYQSMAQQWALDIAELKKELDTRDENDTDRTWKAKQWRLQQANALAGIIGSFTKDKDGNNFGIVNNAIRKLSKPRTMQTIYGAGKSKQLEILTGSDVIEDGIYGKMSDIIQAMNGKQAPEATKDALTLLMKDVGNLTGSSQSIGRFLGKDGNVDINALKKYYLTSKEIGVINSAVQATYGAAMNTAIKKVYAPVIAARAPLNDTVQVAATIYNTVLKKMTDDIMFANNGVITKGQLKKVLKDIDHLIPRIKTPIHTNYDNSSLQLVTVGKNKNYSVSAKVEQAYNGKVSLKRGYAEGIPFLDTVGMAPMVKSIQMIDSMVANHLMGIKADILNNHDGFSHGIKDSDLVREEANKRFAELASYDLGQAYADMNAQLTQAYKDLPAGLVDSTTLIYGEAVVGSDSKAKTGGWLKDRVLTLDLVIQVLKLDKKSVDGRIAEIRKPEKEGDPLMDYFEGVGLYIEEAILSMPLSDKEFTDKVLSTVESNAKHMAEQVTRNKKQVTDSVTQWHQYPHNGFGVDVTPVNPGGMFPNSKGKTIDPDSILSNAMVRANKIIKNMQQLIAEGYASSDTEVSTTPGDYNGSINIDSQNVTEQFDSILEMDEQEPYASVPVSPTHASHLRRVLDDIVAKVMGPVDLYMDRHLTDDETRGKWTQTADKKNQIWIQRQQTSNHPVPGMLGQGVRMSAAEVYAHELVHHISVHGLKDDTLRKQASELREMAYEFFVDSYGANAWRVMLPDPSVDPAGVSLYEKQAAEARFKYVFNTTPDADGRSAGVEEFVAFGMTNEAFKSELAKLVIPDAKIRGRKYLTGLIEKNLQQTLMNIWNRIVAIVNQDFYNQRFSTKGDVQLENLVLAAARIQINSKTALTRHASALEEKATALSINVDERIKSMANKAWSSTKIAKAIELVREIPDLDNLLSHHLRVVLNWYESGEQGFIASVATEMAGTTERFRPLHDLLLRRNRVLDAAKNDVVRKILAVNAELFNGRKLSPQDKTSVTKIFLKGDISSLLDVVSLGAIQAYINDPKQRDDRIQALLSEIKKYPALANHAVFFENAADDLAYWMIHSDARANGVPLMNAHNIALMKDVRGRSDLQGADFDTAVKLIDQLASVMSLKYVSNNHRLLADKLMTEDPKSIEMILIQHKALKKQALADTFNGSPALMQKGYTKQILNSRIQYTQGTRDQADEFIAAGYHMQKTPIKRDPQDPVQVDIFMFKSENGAVNDHQTGIQSTTRNTAMGKTEYDIQVQIGNILNPSSAAAFHNNTMRTVVKDKLYAMTKPRAITPAVPTGSMNYMVPQFNMAGEITKMRYVMSEHTKDTVLQQHSEFDAVMGAMASQIVDKVATPKINAELVMALKELHDSEIKKYPEKYVEIGPNSPNQRYRDIYMMFPEKMKTHILSEWGTTGMMVSQDVIDLAFGQRKYTIVETLAKDSKDRGITKKVLVEVLRFALSVNNPFTDPPPAGVSKLAAEKGLAINRAKKVEDALVQVTKIAKSNIVVRNIGVILGNHASNMMYLKSKGIPLGKILTLSREATGSALKYQETKYELDLLQSKRDIIAGTDSMNVRDRTIKLANADRQIRVLADRLARNPSTSMIAAGLMPQVVDDVDTGSVQSPYKFGIDKGLDTVLSKLGRAEKATRALFMTEDSQGYKIMNNGVKMTDYVGRYVLYNHYKDGGMDHADAVSAVTAEFINFDLPTHRMLEYGNSVGLVWFSKYQLRVLKPIKNLIKERPFTALATFIIGMTLGNNNIINSIPGITKDMTQAFSTGPGALISSGDEILTAEAVGAIGSMF